MVIRRSSIILFIEASGYHFENNFDTLDTDSKHFRPCFNTQLPSHKHNQCLVASQSKPSPCQFINYFNLLQMQQRF